MSSGSFDRGVFVNCPYSPDYSEKLKAIVFVLISLDFDPVFPSQKSDVGEQRIDLIKDLIRNCRHGIHDLSLVIAKNAGEHARMNMPYELGIDLGARWFGGAPLDRKVTLVLERTRGSVKKALSDLAGADLRAHNGRVKNLIGALRDHFYAFHKADRGQVPGDFPEAISLWEDWGRFSRWLQQRPDGTLRTPKDLAKMEIPEFKDKVTEWLAAQSA